MNFIIFYPILNLCRLICAFELNQHILITLKQGLDQEKSINLITARVKLYKFHCQNKEKKIFEST